MLNRTTLFALGTALALALVAGDASARGFGGGGGMRSGGGHIGGGHIGGVGRLGGGSFRHAGLGFRHIGHRWPHHHHHFRWWGWRYPLLVGSTGIATYAATPATNYCSCLTKEYLQDGTVVFKDLCTKEMAANPPVVPNQAALPPVK